MNWAPAAGTRHDSRQGKFHHWWLVVLVLLAGALAVSCRGKHPEGHEAAASSHPSPGPAPAASASSRPQKLGARGLWWKATTPRGTLVLLGSIHVAPRDLYPLDPKIEKAFATADRLVLEVDLNQIDETAMAAQVAARAKYPPGDSLVRHVPQTTVRLLERHAPGAALGVETLEQFRPWFVATTILTTKLQTLGYEAEQGLDMHFAAAAHRGPGRPVSALETLDEQLSLFESLPSRFQALMLQQTLEQVEGLEPMMRRVLGAWRRGDPGPVEAEMLAPLRTPEYRPILEKLLLERNRRWVGKLVALLDHDVSCFVVVGAAHLIGEGSVVDLLRRRHFQVVRQ